MKQLFLFALLLLSPVALCAQCVSKPDDPCVSVNQSILDRAAKGLDELKAARDVIKQFEAERSLNATQQKAADTLIASLNSLVALHVNIEADYAKVLDAYKGVLEAQAKLIDKLTTALNKPQSKFGKFMAAVEKIALIALGISLGRL